MRREFEDLKAPIVELDTAIDALSLLADSQGMRGSNMQDCLNFTVHILRHIYRDLDEKYEAVVATEQDNVPVPLRGV